MNEELQFSETWDLPKFKYLSEITGIFKNDAVGAFYRTHSILSEELKPSIIALNDIVGYHMRNKNLFISKAEKDYPYGKNWKYPDVTYTMNLSGHNYKLQLKITIIPNNWCNFKTTKHENWYLISTKPTEYGSLYNPKLD